MRSLVLLVPFAPLPAYENVDDIAFLLAIEKLD
jgi:hypothetical protein